MLFSMGAVAYAQYVPATRTIPVPSDMLTSDPAKNRAIYEAVQKYGVEAVREALRKEAISNSTPSQQNNGYQNNPYQNNSYQNYNNQYQGYQNDAYNWKSLC